jgi:hypothetical protein
VTETLDALGMKGVPGLPAAVVARAYVQSVLQERSSAASTSGSSAERAGALVAGTSRSWQEEIVDFRPGRH